MEEERKDDYVRWEEYKRKKENIEEIEKYISFLEECLAEENSGNNLSMKIELDVYKRELAYWLDK